MTLIEKLLCRAAKPFTTEKAACSRLAGEIQFGKKSSFTLIKNGIDPSVFKIDYQTRQEMRKTLSYAKNDVVIGHVGRFSEEKNHKFIIELFAAMRKKSDKYKLLLVGDGPLMQDVKTQARSLGVLDGIHFAGSVSNVNRWLQAMDVFILPSSYEGFGMVLIEAQAAGIPCVISTGVPESVMLGKNVVRVDLKDKQLWLEEIEKARLAGITDNTNAIIAAGYDIRDSAGSLLELYTKD